MNEELISQWSEIKNQLTEAETDLIKNAKGNKAAGVRLRKQIKTLQLLLKDLKRKTLEQARG